MKKRKEEITIKLNKKLEQLCDKYGVKAERLFIQFQKDMVGCKTLKSYYRQILAELYLTEFMADKVKVDRSSIESVLTYMKNHKVHQSTKQLLPEGLSKETKRILKECDYQKNHTKN